MASVILGQVGLTGSIGTLPFMVTVLNFTSPSVSSTNLIYNITTPFGSIYSYRREKRMLWRLGILAGLGGIFGALLGPMIRIGPLGDIAKFKVLFGILLGLVGLRLFLKKHAEIRVGRVETSTGSLSKQGFTFSDTFYAYHTGLVLFGGLVAGIISTTFGIGTGFFLVPFYTTVLKLPIYAVAGAALLSTLIISVAGIVVYYSFDTGVSTAPDVTLGLLLGVGGILGGFVSAKVQKHMSSNFLHKLLGATLFLWALAYLRHGL
ncbi:MAG: sulfite exporter TauE/SafE family protein [Candidatus Hydrothermarchaeales archaeon]